MTGWPKRIYSIGYRRTPCMSENDGRAKKASFFLIHSLTSSLKRLHTYIVHTRIYIHVHVHMLLFSVNVRGERDMCVCVFLPPLILDTQPWSKWIHARFSSEGRRRFHSMSWIPTLHICVAICSSYEKKIHYTFDLFTPEIRNMSNFLRFLGTVSPSIYQIDLFQFIFPSFSIE